MAINYTVGERINPNDLSAKRKFYAITQSTGDVTIRELAEEITDLSSLSSGDVMSVIEQLIKLVPKYLEKGKIVRLGDFGNFFTTSKSIGTDSIEDFNESRIIKTSIKFRPGKIVRNVLNNAEYKKIKLN